MKQKVVSHSANGALPPEDLGLDVTAGPILAVGSSHANTTTTFLFEREPARISFDVSAMLAGCAASEALLIVLRKNGPEEPWTRAIIPPTTTRRFLSPRDAVLLRHMSPFLLTTCRRFVAFVLNCCVFWLAGLDSARGAGEADCVKRR
eukprot:COSAG06_NODE_23814_length_680_cov_3.753873_1_plen_147_part_10